MANFLISQLAAIVALCMIGAAAHLNSTSSVVLAAQDECREAACAATARREVEAAAEVEEAEPKPAEPITAAEPARPMPENFYNYEKSHTLAERAIYRLTLKCELEASEITAKDYDCYTIAESDRWRAENPEQAKEFFGERLWRAEFANLVLFENNCSKGRFDNVRSKMFTKWNALSEEQRKQALNHEVDLINKMKSMRDPVSGELWYPGGWEMFCQSTDLHVKRGYWNDMIPNSDGTPRKCPAEAAVCVIHASELK